MTRPEGEDAPEQVDFTGRAEVIEMCEEAANPRGGIGNERVHATPPMQEVRNKKAGIYGFCQAPEKVIVEYNKN